MSTADAPLRVLYLEDNPVDADLTLRALYRQAPEIRLEVFTTLASARERLAEGFSDFDVVLTDLALPDGTGMDMLAHVRDRDLPLAVVIITGSGDQEAAVAALKAGADDYLAKRDRHIGTLPLILTSAISRFRASRERRTRPLRVLYAEPGAYDADLTRRYIAQKAGHIMLEVVACGSEVLARLADAAGADRKPYDVLLMDYRLPGMDALEVTKVLRQELRLRIPIVLITGHGNEEIAIQALRLGVDEYLVKHEGYLLQLPYILEKVHNQAELHRSEANFREISTQFHALLDALPDSITLQSHELKVLWANNGAVTGTGRKPEEVVGMPCHLLRLGREQPCEPCPVRECFRSGKPSTSNVTLPDGRTLELRTVPILQSDRVASVIEVGRDISEHRRLEEQLRHSLKLESIGTLAGGIAHDFNNILTAIIGYGHMAMMGMPGDDPLRMHVQCMLDGADRAAQLTNDLLLFSRKQIRERRPVDLNEIVAKMEKFLRKIIGEDIDYVTTREKGPIPVLADGHQLEQVLMNLVTNARDAMPRGGRLHVTTERVFVDDESMTILGPGKPSRCALVTVSDTGHGMDPEVLSRIFDPFFTTKEVGKGTGLGLSVAYGIVRQHDGFIRVQSDPGKGTTFRIYLPLIDGEELRDRAAPGEEVPARGTETILLAEDDGMVRKLAKALLTEFGYSVFEAVDGEDAVRKFMENREAVDLLMLDIVMPKMNGKEAYDEIRRMKPDVKVIFASGYAAETVMQKGLLESGLPVITKPVTPAELARRVRSVLDGTAQ